MKVSEEANTYSVALIINTGVLTTTRAGCLFVTGFKTTCVYHRTCCCCGGSYKLTAAARVEGGEKKGVKELDLSSVWSFREVPPGGRAGHTWRFGCAREKKGAYRMV